MSDRLAKARRIVAVREQMHKIAEWEQARLVREHASLERTRGELLASYDHDQFGRLFAESVARRLAQVSRAAQVVVEAKSRQEEKVREEALALKRAERLETSAEEAARSEADKKAFQALVEASATASSRDKGNASLA